MMVDCPTFDFMIPPNNSSQTVPLQCHSVPSNTIQEKIQNLIWATLPPATVDGHAQAQNFVSPKRLRTESMPFYES